MEAWFVLDAVLKYKTSGDSGLRENEETKDCVDVAFAALNSVSNEDDSKKFASHIKSILFLYRNIEKTQAFAQKEAAKDTEQLLTGYFKLLATGNKRHLIYKT